MMITAAAFQLTVLVTILALVVYIWCTLLVGGARRRHGVEAPATSGPDEFNRVFRIQQNTLEQLVLFIPALWLAYSVFGAIWPALAGILWPLGRVIYTLSYRRDPAKRGLGFSIAFLTSVGLLLAALVGVIRFAL